MDFERLDAIMRDPYPLYARARTADGLTFVPELNAWLVARDADARTVLRDAATFSSANALRPDVVPPPSVLAAMAGGPGRGPVVVTSDGETHRKLRAPLSRGLSPGRVEAVLPYVTERAEALVGAFAADGHADLMERFAQRLPGEVLGHLLGLGPADAELAVRRSREAERLVFRPLDEPEQHRVAAEVVALRTMLDEHVSRRFAEPGDDLTGELVRALVPDGGSPTPEQHGTLVSNLQNILLAGHLTTTAMIGNAVRHLLDHREQWELLVARPELIPAAVEETARYDTALQGFRRITTRPVTLAGTELPEGAEVFVAYGATGRDGDAYERPDVFDITREPGRHLAFGHGPHACPGSQLAREQVRIALETLARRLPGLRHSPAAPPIANLPTMIHRQPESLPVVWDPPLSAPERTA